MMPARIRTFATATTGILVLLISTTLWILLVSSKSRTREINTEAQAKRKDLAETKAALQKAAQLNSKAGSEGMQAVTEFQSWLSAEAEAGGCELADCQVADQTAPFITRYQKDTKEKDWGQIDVRATLQGPTAKVMTTLAALTRSPVAIEIDKLDTSRLSTASNGTATINARLELRILTRSHGGQG